jgi:glutamine amidotransferase
MITIIDNGGANLSSVIYSLNRLGVDAEVSHDATVIKKSTHLILPGVTSAATAMKRLASYQLIDVIRSLTQPVLGICLGMQILFEHSEEGKVECLKILRGNVKKLIPMDGITVPHMGWNTINKISSCKLLKDIPDLSYVYYVHSYAADVTQHTCAVTSHGKDFAAIVQCENFYGTQFHPEKSGETGSRILKNFLEC